MKRIKNNILLLIFVVYFFSDRQSAELAPALPEEATAQEVPVSPGAGPVRFTFANDSSLLREQGLESFRNSVIDLFIQPKYTER